jgi:glycerophosphoryl diester phosphodiesterase
MPRALHALPLAVSVLLASPAVLATGACPAGSLIISGHRGSGETSQKNPFPENTLPSFQRGREMGADVAELDVHLSSDGQLVVMHDDRVDRTTDGTGCLSALTLAEIRSLDAAEGTPLAGTGVKVPTFAEVLAAVSGDMDVELKLESDSACPKTAPEDLAQAMAAALDAEASPGRVQVSSFSWKALDALAMARPGTRRAILSAGPIPPEEAVSHGVEAVQINFATITDTMVPPLREAGIEVHAWTVGSTTRMRELYALGVTTIITNVPDVMVAERNALCDEESGGGTGGSGGAAGAENGGAAGGGRGGTSGAEPGTSTAAASDDDGGCAVGAAPSRASVDAMLFAMVGLLATRRRRGSLRTPCAAP